MSFLSELLQINYSKKNQNKTPKPLNLNYFETTTKSLFI